MSHGFKAKCLSQIEIPEALRKEFRDELFYWDDLGNHDKNRVILFITEKNQALFYKHHDWMADDTFYINPTFFKQVYTVHKTFLYFLMKILRITGVT